MDQDTIEARFNQYIARDEWDDYTMIAELGGGEMQNVDAVCATFSTKPIFDSLRLPATSWPKLDTASVTLIDHDSLLNMRHGDNKLREQALRMLRVREATIPVRSLVIQRKDSGELRAVLTLDMSNLGSVWGRPWSDLERMKFTIMPFCPEVMSEQLATHGKVANMTVRFTPQDETKWSEPMSEAAADVPAWLASAESKQSRRRTWSLFR